LTEITTRYNRGMQQSICEATTRTTLRRMGYNSGRPQIRQPGLTSLNFCWVHCTKMAPTVTRSQPNRASLGCGGTGASCPGPHKSPSTARCYPINMGQHF